MEDSTSVKFPVDVVNSIQSADVVKSKAKRLLDEIDLSNKKLKALNSTSK